MRFQRDRIKASGAGKEKMAITRPLATAECRHVVGGRGAPASPYIGPFYPYPQVPLGWRNVSLEGDDGWWMLDFKG